MVEMFDKIGLGQWFRYLTGGLEVTGAILLLVETNKEGDAHGYR